MIDLFQRAVAWLMNRVRVNHIRQGMWDGVPVFVKRRRAGGTMCIWFANRFLAWAQSGICMFVRADEWLEWEIHCARLLYPERSVVKISADRALITSRCCGSSLRQLLRRDEPDVNALVLAARELRRVHQIQCSYYQAAWSHGDLHLDNIVCDLAAERAVLIDFDTRHEFRVSPLQRHSDDLKVALLELIGMSDDKWLPLATAFLEEYGERLVLNELGRQLFIPRGFAKILWHARTNCASTGQIENRFKILREVIHRVTTPASKSSQPELHRHA
jgi:hypothetical protein